MSSQTPSSEPPLIATPEEATPAEERFYHLVDAIYVSLDKAASFFERKRFGEAAGHLSSADAAIHELVLHNAAVEKG